MAKDNCETCANTGVLSASLVFDDLKGERKIRVKPCTHHFNSDLLDKNVAAMVKTGLPVSVVDTKKD